MHKLSVAAHHLGCDTFNATIAKLKSAGFNPFDQVGLYRRSFAFNHDWFKGLHLEQAAHIEIGIVRNQNPANWRGVFQPTGEIDRIANRREFGVGADMTQQHRPSINADSHCQMKAVALAKFMQRRLHRQRPANRPFWVVLAGGLRSPQGHHRIANVLIHHAAVVDNRRINHLPQGIHRGRNIFGIQRFAQRREARNVSEQDCHLFTLFHWWRWRCWRLQRGEFFANLRDQRIHNRITQNSALRLQNDNGLFKLLLFIRHGLLRIGRCGSKYAEMSGVAHVTLRQLLSRRVLHSLVYHTQPFAGSGKWGNLRHRSHRLTRIIISCCYV